MTVKNEVHNVITNKWKTLIWLLNTSNPGDLIYRKEIMGCFDLNPALEHSINAYLTAISCLERTIKPGVYKLIKKPLLNLTVKTAKYLAYGKQ